MKASSFKGKVAVNWLQFLVWSLFSRMLGLNTTTTATAAAAAAATATKSVLFSTVL